jgi:hypothetical protein
MIYIIYTCSLTKHSLKWKPFRLETYTSLHYLMLIFYQINRDGEIRTRDCLVIKALIPCQRTNLTQKLKLLDKVSRYNLYYSLSILTWTKCMFFLMDTFIIQNRVYVSSCSKVWLSQACYVYVVVCFHTFI